MNVNPVSSHPAADAGSVDLLAHELVAAVREYFFSYDVEDMMRAISIWQKLRPLIVDSDRGFAFDFKLPSRRAARQLKSSLRAVIGVSSLRSMKMQNPVDATEFAVTGMATSVDGLSAAFDIATTLAHCSDWSAVSQNPIPRELFSELDRLQRVLEWTCDFEAAHALYPHIPRSGFDSVRAAIFLLASEWQPSLRNSEGWTLHDIHHPEFHPLEREARTFDQATFSVSERGISYSGGSRQIAAPVRGYFIVNDAELFGGGTVMCGHGLVDFDPCQRSVLDFVAGRWDHVVGSSATLERAGVLLPDNAGGSYDQGILLSGRADTNWYHWLIEHLARLVQIDNVIDAAVPIVVSDRLSPAALNVVRAVTDREIIVAPVAERTQFGSLILPSNTVLHTDTLELPWHKGTSIDFMAVDELARRILQSRGSLDSKSPRRIFWHRDSMYRNLTNQDELIEVAKRWGFTVIHPETCSLSDQVTLFRNAEVVITAMGAVTPNYLFMQPGAHIVSFTSQASADYVFPGVIGHHVTGSFRTLIGEYQKTGEERSRLDYFHQPFRVEPALLEDELSRVLDRH